MPGLATRISLGVSRQGARPYGDCVVLLRRATPNDRACSRDASRVRLPQQLALPLCPRPKGSSTDGEPGCSFGFARKPPKSSSVWTSGKRKGTDGPVRSRHCADNEFEEKARAQVDVAGEIATKQSTAWVRGGRTDTRRNWKSKSSWRTGDGCRSGPSFLLTRQRWLLRSRMPTPRRSGSGSLGGTRC